MMYPRAELASNRAPREVSDGYCSGVFAVMVAWTPSLVFLASVLRIPEIEFDEDRPRGDLPQKTIRIAIQIRKATQKA